MNSCFTHEYLDINLFNCGGIRVFYYDRTKHASPCSMECFISDHDHTSEWNDECLKKQEYRCLETGTVVRCWRNHIDYTCCLDVWWDCGTKKMYTRERGEWENVCVLDMGPAGERTRAANSYKGLKQFIVRYEQ